VRSNLTSTGEQGWFRKSCALFNFPLIESGFADEVMEEITYPGLLRPSHGGFQYWNFMALLWPIPLVWSLACVTIIGTWYLLIQAFDILVAVLSFPGNICRRCEEKIRSAVGTE